MALPVVRRSSTSTLAGTLSERLRGRLPERVAGWVAGRVAGRSVQLLAGLLVASSFAAVPLSASGAEAPARAGAQLGVQAGAQKGAQKGAQTGVQAFARKGFSPRVRTTRFSSSADFKAGTLRGVTARRGSLKISTTPKGTRWLKNSVGTRAPQKFDYGRWVSPWVEPGFDASSLIPSWNAKTPAGTHVRIDARTKSATGVSSWDKVALWSFAMTGVDRYSGPSQTDDHNRLLTDTLISQGSHRMRAWQVRVTLFRPIGATGGPRLDSAGAVAANYTTRTRPTSPTRMKATTELAVPGFSQMTHTGHYPQWGGGGEAWCSPTSAAMVLRHHGKGPKPADYAWTREADGQVDFAARHTYDNAYRGTGNWSFNAAYAGQYGMDSFVTRMRNLRDAERFIRHGLPVIASIKFSRGGLDGSPLTSTPGHLVVITGFTGDGRVIVNDPSASRNSGVRRIYRRDQFEQAWLGGSGGVAYVIRPKDKRVPSGTKRW